jgi:hypothetical protein
MDLTDFLRDLRGRVETWGKKYGANVMLAEETVHAMELLEGGGRGVNVVLWYDGDDAGGPDEPESTIHTGKIWFGVTRHAGLARHHFANMIDGDAEKPALLGIVQDLRKFLYKQAFETGLHETPEGAWFKSDGMAPLSIAPGQFLRGYALRMRINYTALVAGDEPCHDAPTEGEEK